VDPTDTSARVINVDTQRLDNDGSYFGKGSDVVDDPYSLGVLLSDMDGPVDLGDLIELPGDINGADRQSDDYTFGVLQADEDPMSDLELLRLLSFAYQ